MFTSSLHDTNYPNHNSSRKPLFLFSGQNKAHLFDSPGSTDIYAEIQNFLDKIDSGTVSEEDIQVLENKFNKIRNE